ncbi:MAG: PilZ domain-containing protein [Acidobacteriota bacterium]|nr:PilZ domain-containing protein [Acidobacteriota bacterium]
MPTERRRSDRLMLTVPLWVFGTDEKGDPFECEGRTIDVSRHGARIRVARPLRSGDELRIVNQLNRREAVFRVAGPVAPLTESGGEFALAGPLSTKPEKRSEFGMECLDLTADLWGIRFPPTTGDQDAEPKALVSCRECKSSELARLTLSEVDVLDTAGIISHFCPACKGVTPWGYSQIGGKPGVREPGKPEAADPQTPREKRKHRRVLLQLPTLIRDYFGGVEITKSENVSKGGICFASEKNYQIGEGIMVACPYNKASQDIEVQGVITSVKDLEGAHRKVYGVRYRNT